MSKSSKAKYEAWEKKIFLHAKEYSVVIHEGLDMGSRLRGTRQRFDFRSFPEALAQAEASGARSLIYANSIDHQSACLDREKWEMYKSIWPMANNAKEE
jgi:hypothetical protein